MSALPVPSRLGELEGVIERGLATFVEVGQALLEIRDEDLYPSTHGTFERYCEERWGFTDRRARQFMAAAEVVAEVAIAGTIVPATESVARVLAPLRGEPTALRDAWSVAVEQHGPTPTAAQVRAIVSPPEPEVPLQPVTTEVFSAPPQTRGQLSNQRGGTDEWATPQDFFDAVNAEFNFTLDVCALDSSAKCKDYFTPEHDGLKQDWTGTVWMNPPYGNEIVDWIRKAYESAQAGATVACLVPARVDTGWWWDYCRHGEVRFLRGRLRFGDADASAPFPSVLVVFGRGTSTTYWEWR